MLIAGIIVATLVTALVISWIAVRLSVTTADLEQLVPRLLADRDEKMEAILRQSREPGHLSLYQLQSEIHRISRETMALAIAARRWVAHLFAAGFGWISVLILIKSWVWPNSKDLRMLLGSEMFILCQFEGRSAQETDLEGP